MLIFSNTPGVVGAVITGQTLPFAIAIGGNTGVPSFPGFRLVKSILTSFDIEEESGLGVTHTLRDRIYIYLHGERAGAAMISGIAFAGICSDNGPQYTGMDAVIAYYERVRASAQGLPIRLIFGPRTSMVGFMRKFRIGVADPASGVGAFSFQFVTIPSNAGRFGYQRPLPWESLAAATSIPKAI